MNRVDTTGHFSGWAIIRKNISRVVEMGRVPRLAKSAPRLMFSAGRKGAVSAVARGDSLMGDFTPFENMPDVIGEIIGNLKSEDIVAFSATSSRMLKAVGSAKNSLTRLLNPAALKNSNKAIQTAWDVATGKMPRTTPSQLRTLGITNPYAIPHQIDEYGFASLDEIKRRFHLRELAEVTQKNIRERLD